MNRSIWRSRRGEPLSLTELVLARTVATLLVIASMAWVTASVGAGFAVGLAAYLTMDRVQVIIDWRREVLARRRADARMLTALRRRTPAHMAVRP